MNCFFNTGFEFKVKNTYEILMFGGTGHGKGERPYQEWTRRDIPFLQIMLSALERNLQISVPIQLIRFESSLEGTWELQQFLETELKHKDSQLSSQYIFGCLLLHQLLYCFELIALYDV
jgi:hypothetical protein